ncbi:MAG: aa3-type cytochrome c oxidase subunit IV [Hyphomicrobiaceae bacterium]|nr:aa3-type cytochrome c oxidase subunit IV [Hyphomicrobiaceae bacterium]
MSEPTTANAMDYAEHKRTYSLFIEGGKVLTVLCLTVVVALALVHVGAPVLASLLVIAGLVTSAIGLAVRPNGVISGVVVFVIGLLGLAVLGIH